jgi:predicted GIY-YIG superfamily endonuclease
VWVYILRCGDGSYYTGMTVDPLRRLAEHQSGVVAGYTHSRRPVALVWSSSFGSRREAATVERKIKGWSRAKKEALIRGDFDAIHDIVVAERRRRERKRLSGQSEPPTSE